MVEPLKPTTIKVNTATQAFIDALAAYLSEKRGRVQGRGPAVEYLAAQFKPPEDLNPEAASLRRAHKELPS